MHAVVYNLIKYACSGFQGVLQDKTRNDTTSPSGAFCCTPRQKPVLQEFIRRCTVHITH